jgi:hypothetical protein
MVLNDIGVSWLILLGHAKDVLLVHASDILLNHTHIFLGHAKDILVRHAKELTRIQDLVKYFI